MKVDKASDSDPESLEPSIESISLNSGILLKAQHILNGPDGLNIMLADGDVLLNVSPANVQYKEPRPRRERPKGGRPAPRKKGGCGCGKKKE